MKYLILFSFFIIFFSCKEKNTLSELKIKALQGDTIAYEELHNYYFENNYDGLLKYSYVLTKKYNYAKAYYDIFEIIYATRGKGDCIDYNLNCLEREDSLEAMKNLNKARQMGYKPAQVIYEDFVSKKK